MQSEGRGRLGLGAASRRSEGRAGLMAGGAAEEARAASMTAAGGGSIHGGRRCSKSCGCFLPQVRGKLEGQQYEGTSVPFPWPPMCGQQQPASATSAANPPIQQRLDNGLTAGTLTLAPSTVMASVMTV